MDFDWWKQKHGKKLNSTLLQHSFNKTNSFGKLGYFGYEESWKKDGIKVDLFSSVFNGSHRTIPFWVYQLYNCSYPVSGVQEVTKSFYATYFMAMSHYIMLPSIQTCHVITPQVTVPMWGDRKVRLPYPVEPALAVMFGANWRHDLSIAWRTAIDPFLVGFCNPLGADGRYLDVRKKKDGNAFVQKFYANKTA